MSHEATLGYYGSAEILEFVARVYLNERGRDSKDIMRIVERNRREMEHGGIIKGLIL